MKTEEPSRGRHLDLSSDATVPADKTEKPSRFLGIRFGCCDVYSRIYINDAGEAYEGRCPRCGQALRVTISAGGSESRFFEVL
jgi:hypothetical protein